MESPLFGIQTKKNWKNIYGLAWATSVIFDNLEKIVDQIQKRDRMAKLSDVLQDMPQTEILVGTFLRNLSPVILDIVDMITLRPVPLVSGSFPNVFVRLILSNRILRNVITINDL